MFRIKICGITNPDDALLAAEAGADAIGLNFYERSPRYVTTDVAAQILERLREDHPADQVQVVAIFVNATLDDLLWTIRDANLYGPDTGLTLQIHGDEPPSFLAELRSHGLGVTDSLLQATGHVPVVPVYRAFRCRSADLADVQSYLNECEALGALPQGLLLDAYAPGSYGGSGTTLDWPAVARRPAKLRKLPVVLAGGLTAANVAAAIAAAQPEGVDVASGVESAPGRKDPRLVRAFIAEAMSAFDNLQRVQ